ncbi:hypothetical protein BLNAU_15210 [Blattamonas nauphoetae]|uniref:Uncharacterized protein n=1 Tax=Blattamonas nauphoetae TaxID=2049346 RepID=A0ABQ9XF23_9EUKA|nr:hypothetical protein BLNAU_15210 [Blattamonas nauphoetae]
MVIASSQLDYIRSTTLDSNTKTQLARQALNHLDIVLTEDLLAGPHLLADDPPVPLLISLQFEACVTLREERAERLHQSARIAPALLRLPLSTLLTLPFSDQIAVLRHLNPTQDRTAISATTSPSSEQKRDFTSPSSASSGTDINRWLSSRSPKSTSTVSSRLKSVEERNEEPKTADERFRSSDELRQASALPAGMHSVQLPNQTIQPSSPSDAFIRMSQMSSPLSM